MNSCREFQELRYRSPVRLGLTDIMMCGFLLQPLQPFPFCNKERLKRKLLFSLSGGGEQTERN